MCSTAEILNRYPKKNDIKIEVIADLMGKNPATLRRRLSENDPYSLPVTDLIPFIRACGDDLEILDHIESRFNRVAIVIPTEKTEIGLGSVARLAKESGGAIAVYAGAMIDGKMDKQEARECLQELHDLSSTTMSLIKEIQKTFF